MKWSPSFFGRRSFLIGSAIYYYSSLTTSVRPLIAAQWSVVLPSSSEASTLPVELLEILMGG